MFFYRREDNIIMEEHKDPISVVFFLGGLGGFLSASHYIFIVVEEYDTLKIIEWLVSGWCFTGVLSIGLFRSFQYIFKKGEDVHTLTSKIQYILFGITMMTLIACCSAIFGAVLLAFIDFMGGGLIGMRGSLTDFFKTLGGALLMGMCIGLCMSFFLSVGTVKQLLSRKWFLISASLGGGMCGGSIVSFNQTIIFSKQLPLYGAIYGLLFGLSLIICTIRKQVILE